MLKKFLLVFFFIFSMASLKAQNNYNWVYDFGTSSISCGEPFPIPQNNGGTAIAYSAPDGCVELVNSDNAGGSGAELKVTSSSSNANTKFGFGNYAGTALGTFECSFKLASGSDNGRFIFLFGSGSNYTNTNGINTSQTFVGLRISFNRDYNNDANKVYIDWLETSNGYSNNKIIINKNQTYKLRFYLNNSTANATYFGPNSTLSTLPLGTFDVWLDNEKILTNAAPTGLLSQGTVINSMNLLNVATGSSKPIIYIDNIKYSNYLPKIDTTITVNENNLNSPASITITANTVDSDGTITKVEFFHGVNKLGEDLTAPYSFNWSNVPSGNYTITSKATYNSGATTTSKAVNVKVIINDEISALKTKYFNWLTDANSDYSNVAVLDRYKQFVSSGNSAKNLTAYNFASPGAVWDFRNKVADRDEYKTLVEQKLIPLVFLFQLKGPVANPNPDYHSDSLKDMILNIFNYLRAKGISSNTDFVIDETSYLESVDINSSVALRSSSYAASILLMKDELKAAGEFTHHIGALQALTYFVAPTFNGFNFTYPGFNADVMRVSCQQRLCYILAQDDTSSDRLTNMNHLKKFINNGLSISKGWSDCIKPDFMTYHHRGVYSNAYGENMIHQISILNMILKGSPYELDAVAVSNLKEALMNYTKFTKGFEMPRGLGGRFPFSTDVIDELRPAYAYLYLADPTGNEEAGREFVRLWGISASANTALQQSISTSINLVNTMGAIQNIVTVLNAGLSPLAERTEGQFNFPYAGLSVHKYNGYQVSVKGSSKYIWNYESSNTENIYGRYTSAGSMEILTSGNPLTHATNGYIEKGWDWSRTPGVTAAYVPLSIMAAGTHRLFSGKSFLGHASLDNNGVFAMDFTDANSGTSMTGLKTVFFFKDKMLCMGSNFKDQGGTYPIQTTLFQTNLADITTPTYVNGNVVIGNTYNFSQTGGGFWATDAVGNGYVVPIDAANTESITVSRSTQNSRNSGNTENTMGDFATAYINHGVAPTTAKYVYGILMQGGQSGTQDFANNFASYFQVLNQNSDAHIAKYIPDGIYAYAIYNPAATFTYDVVKSVNKPAVVMTQKLVTGNKLKVSLTNPNIGLESTSENFTFNEIGSSSSYFYRVSPFVEVKLNIVGHWGLAAPMKNVTATINGENTDIIFSTVNGLTIQTELVSITTIWDGTAWSNGTPDSTKEAVLTGAYFTSGNLSVKKLTINAGGSLTVNSGNNVTVQDEVVNNGGTITVENNANLIQVNNTTNTGNVTIKRNSQNMVLLDYTLWSSPVAAQNLFAFSPNTVTTPTTRFYSYNTATNSFDNTGITNTSTFTAGKGYAVRAPKTFNATPAVFTGTFTGVPNNGNVSIALDATTPGFNLVGNPYPSPINASAFVAANSSLIDGTLYFFSHNLKSNGTTYETGSGGTGMQYATWNGTGATAAASGVSNNGQNTSIPTGVIQTGQGFIVKSTTAGNLSFTNAMRVGAATNTTLDPFFKMVNTKSASATIATEKHRLWLDLTDEKGEGLSQLLVGYVDGASDGVDSLYDGEEFGNPQTSLTSLLNGKNYTIQGRALPFADTDSVPLAFKAAANGTYTIALAKTDGIFSNQEVFLKDNVTGTVTNLKTTGYTFTATAGTANTRFELAYSKSVINAMGLETAITAVKKQGVFQISTNGAVLKEITVYDIQGHEVLKQHNINSTSSALTGLPTTRGISILKVTTENNQVQTVKIIN